MYVRLPPLVKKPSTACSEEAVVAEIARVEGFLTPNQRRNSPQPSRDVDGARIR